MPDPVMIAIAVALATNAVEGLSHAGRSAFAALTRVVRDKLGGSPQTRALLIADAGDDTGIRRFAAALERAATADGDFDRELRRRWASLRDEPAITVQGDVVNRVSGDVRGSVVQARDVHGGISFGTP